MLKSVNRQNLAPFVAAIAAAAGVAVMLFQRDVLNDGDTWWHLGAGRWMLEHGRIPNTDIFSYTKAGAPWQAHEWLSEILMAAAYQAGQWNGVALLFGLVAAVTAGLLAWRLSNAITGITFVAALVLGLACTNPSLLYRPHLLVLPILIVWTWQMLAARDADRAPPLALALLMILWANMHGSFVFGFLIAGVFGLEALVEAAPDQRLRVIRQWGLFAAALTLAGLVTPHGVQSYIFPFQVMTMSILNDIREWRPTDFSKIGTFEIALLFTIFVCLYRGVKVKPLRLALLILLLHMSLQHRRHLLVLSVLAPLLLAEPLGQALAHTPKAAGRKVWALALAGFAAVFVAMAGYRLAVPLKRGDDAITPMTALSKVPAELRVQPVYNEYSMGGYLIFAGVKVFIDGRADMYGDEFVKEYMTTYQERSAVKFDKQLKTYDVRWSVMPPSDGLVPLLDKKPGWRRLYADKWAVVHVRNDALPPPPTSPKPAPQ